MSTIYKTTECFYEAMNDSICARAYLHETHDGVVYHSEETSPLVVELEHAFHGKAEIKFVKYPTEPMNCPLPAILAAFCEKWQSKHDDENPGDCPSLTVVDLFVV